MTLEIGLLGAIEAWRYNESDALGQDRDFGKDARFLRPIERPPFYGGLRPAAIGAISYGVQIDAFGHVLHESQVPIEGLFAAGECTGGTSDRGISAAATASCSDAWRVARRRATRWAWGGDGSPTSAARRSSWAQVSRCVLTPRRRGR